MPLLRSRPEPPDEPVATTAAARIADLSLMVVDLRTFVTQQATVNRTLLDELRRITEHVTSFTEFTDQYSVHRDALQDRFGRINEHVMRLDADFEAIYGQGERNTASIAKWRRRWWLLLIASMLSNVAMSVVGHLLLK